MKNKAVAITIVSLAFLVVALSITTFGGCVAEVELRKEVTQLRALKTHFYDFRKRVMHTIPVDYLSEVTIGDFDFDKYLEDE